MRCTIGNQVGMVVLRSARWQRSRARDARASGNSSRKPGLPGSLPRAFAALIPALVRSEINARSSWATAPRTCSENMPCGVDVSIGSCRERKCGALLLLDYLEQMADGARPTIKADNYKHVTGFNLAQ